VSTAAKVALAAVALAGAFAAGRFLAAPEPTQDLDGQDLTDDQHYDALFGAEGGTR
jgi:hypothetical protein